MSPYSSQQIADWFIARSRAELRLDDSAEQITNIKLNKLMYFTQGIYLALYDEKLFDDRFYASELGPISNEMHKKYQGKDIPELDGCISDDRAIQLARNYDQILSDIRAAEVLNTTWYEFGDYTASELVTISHDKDGPWAKVYKKGKFWIPINDEDIKRYFKDSVIECHV